MSVFADGTAATTDHYLDAQGKAQVVSALTPKPVAPYYWNTQTLSYQVGTTGGSGVGQEVKVTNFPATQPVSATSWPLPTGASTSAAQTTTNGYLSTLTTYAGIARTAFGWLRTADPVTLFDQTGFRYGKEPLMWEDVLTGTGATTHNANPGTITLSTGGTAANAGVRRTTKQYHRYQPGKGGLVLVTGVMGTANAKVQRDMGLFDDDNGFMLREVNGSLSLVIRTKTSGSVVENVIPQASWNGTAVSLDTTKSILAGFAYEWLGVGRLQLLLADPVTEELVIAHTEGHVNTAAVPYTATACLPVSYQIKNTDTASGTFTMTQICCSVISEGGWEQGRGITFAAGNGTTTIGVTTRRPILSVRPATTFGGVTNRTLFDLIHMELTAANNSCYWELVYNGTLTNASFANVDATNSAMQVDVAATAISGGVVLEAGYATSGTGATRGWVDNSLTSRIAVGLDAAGTTATNVSLVITSLSGTSNVGASIHWRETR